MKKSKLNANPVGANCIRPHFEGMTQNGGITLIALIITIIVMLILVGVTINVALNGGLFDKASEAKRLTQLESDKEELQLEIVTAYNEKEGIVNLETLATNLEDKEWNVTESGDNLICTSKNENTFIVDKKGKITEVGAGGGNGPVTFSWASVKLGNVDTSAEYKGYIALLDMTGIISFTEDGRIIMNANGSTIEKDAKDEKNIDKATRKLSFSIELMEGIDSNIIITMNENNTDVDFQVVGVETVKCVKQEKTIYTNEEVLKSLGATGGTYEGTWTKIGTENGKIKLVSTSNVARYTLGSEDPRATNPTIEGALDAGASDLDIAIWSYKNAVNSLNAVAQEATGISSARSVKIEDIEMLAGIQDSDKGPEYLKEYTYNYTKHKDKIFVDENGDIVKIDSEETEVTLKNTFYPMEISNDKLGMLAVNGKFYWLASPCIDCGDTHATFNVYYMGTYMGNSIITTTNGLFNSAGSRGGFERGVRAIVYVSDI